MSKPKKFEDAYVRINISLCPHLKKRMMQTGINWSQVASRAFEEALRKYDAHCQHEDNQDSLT